MVFLSSSGTFSKIEIASSDSKLVRIVTIESEDKYLIISVCIDSFNSTKTSASILKLFNLIKLSLFKQKSLNKKIYNKKITLVLYRAIGERDVRIVQKSSNKTPQIIYMRRSIVKIIFYFFSSKRKFFFSVK